MTPFRLARIKQQMVSAGQEVKSGPHTQLVGVENDATTLGKPVKSSRKAKWSYHVTSNAAPRCVPKESESTRPYKHVCVDVLTTAISTADKGANGPKA